MLYIKNGYACVIFNQINISFDFQYNNKTIMEVIKPKVINTPAIWHYRPTIFRTFEKYPTTLFPLT